MLQEMKSTILAMFLFGGSLIFSSCEESASQESQSGAVDGMSYHAFWSDNSRTKENLSLLVIANYANDQSLAKGQRLGGTGHDPVLSGYFDRDGEIVSFALLRSDNLLILDKYLLTGKNPIAYVFRDDNGLLDAKLLSADAPQAAAVINAIRTK